MSRSTTKRSDNRARILDAAKALFNAEGTAAISTNHIASEAGVSPGNLYYHFENKDHIIREIYERFVESYERIWGAGSSPMALLQMVDVVIAGFEINWEYRFIVRELAALNHRDPVFRKRQREVYAKRFERISSLIRQAAEAGYLTVPDQDDAIEDLVHLEWLINQYWILYTGMQQDEIDETSVKAGARIALRAMEPYLNPQFHSLLTEHLATL